MEIRNVNLKTRIFAHCVGFLYVVAVVLTIGLQQGALAAESDPRSQLELIINERMDTEIKALNEQLIYRIETDRTRDAKTGARPESEVLLASNLPAKPRKDVVSEDVNE
jgi:hypothetical protein